MISRRIIEHLRKQHWTAIAIDFLIVVIGVFIGLQVDNWSKDQADKRRGQAYVARLQGDLTADLTSTQQLTAYYDAVYQSAERTHALLADPKSDPKALVINAYRASEYAYTPPKRSTWDEIVSSGDIGLLPQHAVDDGLAVYFSVDTARSVLDALKASSYRHRVRSMLPHEIQNAIRESCGDIRDASQRIIGFNDTCKLDVSDAAMASAAAELRKDPGLIADLRYQFSDLISARANLRGDIKFIEAAQKGLAKN